MHTSRSAQPSAMAWNRISPSWKGIGPGGLEGLVPVPTAEFCDDPSSPSEAVWWMRVFLQLCLAFEVLVERDEGVDLGVIERHVSWLMAATVARLHELDDDGGGFGSNGDKPFQPLGS